MSGETLLEARAIDIAYSRRSRRGDDPRIVRDVEFSVRPGEVLALVGESGSGKTTVARAIVGLVRFDGEMRFGPARTSLSGHRSHELRRQIQMVFQDPRSSLNPRMTVEAIVREAWRTHPVARPEGDLRSETVRLLDRVGLPESVLDRRPGQLSGGQCQRVSIARALALKPRLIVCDEAVSALDVSVQAQILRLLLDLKESFGISLLFITHDLGVVRQIADAVAVMEKGEIVEQGGTEAIFTSPQHPYTRALLGAALDLRVDDATPTAPVSEGMHE
ncbi:ABC transporter ATP-binding protein [Agromyces laixinhei]|uniref:ABC transporter ATP-binding protein n=1 Tax=Agromyces laixinhei TaxID=2585717 RepID=UPI0012EE516F|nr:ATP-binding cassette domain-containing protein [Agromyces laixinhei]